MKNEHKIKVRSYVIAILALTLYHTGCFAMERDEENDVIPNKRVKAQIASEDKEVDIFTGVFYRIQKKNNNKVLSGWEDPQKFSEEIDDNPPPSDRLWALVDSQYNHAPGFYRIRNKKTGKVFDGWEDIYKFSQVADDNVWHPNRMWKLIEAPSPLDAYFRLQKTQNKKVLHAWGDKNKFSQEPDDNLSHPDRLWRFILAPYKLSADITDFKYQIPSEDVLNKNKKVSVIETATLNNRTEAQLEHTFKCSKKLTHSFSFGFKESLKISFKASFKASEIFFDEKFEFNSEIGFEANQKVTDTQEKTYEITDTIKVPSHKSIKVTAYVNMIDNLEIPFTARAKVVGTTDRLKKDGSIVNMNAEGELVKYCFLKDNPDFKESAIIVDGDSLLVEIHGIIKGETGLDTQISLENL